MKPGHAFTIEPMICEGMLPFPTLLSIHNSFDIPSLGVWSDQLWPDNWTAVTVDGKLSAQFEQTMIVTENGVEVLTARPGKEKIPYFMEQ
jgi:methionyl aminopeptidase